jgi:Flp pilus assembly protein TadG
MLLIRTAVLRAIDAAASRMRSFQKDERGAIIVLTLFLFLAMVLVTGVAIDVVRTEHARTKLQGTLDRAILAAASNENKLDPKQVVMSYFQKAGLGAYMSLDQIEVEDDERYVGGERDITFRTVFATTSANVPTMFLNRVGINDLPAPAAGRADEGMSPVEVVLVLDVSGSMIQNNDMQKPQLDGNGNPIVDANGNPTMVTANRLEALKISARQFIDLLYSRPENVDRIAFAIVPYAWNVNFDLARNSYGKPTGAPDTGCLVFNDPADYRTEQVQTGQTWGRAAHADSFSYAYANMTGTDSQDWDADGNKSESRTLAPALPRFSTYSWDCPKRSYTVGNTTVQTGQMVLPYTNDRDALITHINAMQAGGSTSIEIGMKWGVHMIDPSFRPVNADMIAAGHTPAEFSPLPRDYGYRGTRKYIILMTDGENMPSYLLNPAYRDGLSPIFEGIRSGRKVYSYYDPDAPGTADYFYARTGTWNTTPDRDTGTAVQLTWPQVWDRLTVSWAAYHLFAKRINSASPGTWYNANYRDIHGNYAEEVSTTGTSSTMMTRVNSSEKDTRLNDICSTVRDNELVTVFTVSFRSDATEVKSEADLLTAPRGDRSLAKCASTFAHHYRAQNTQALQSAFGSIARQILDLRLTQ